MRSLLDVNCLIALFDQGHDHHELVTDWFLTYAGNGWLSCPITQNGCVRIMSSPSYPRPSRATDVIQTLRTAFNHPSHSLIPDDVSICNAKLKADMLLTSAQITDVYLLQLACSHGANFVTLDRRIPIGLLPWAKPSQLVVLGEPDSQQTS